MTAYRQQLGSAKDSLNHTKYTKLRNKFNSLKRNAKKEFYASQILKFKDDSRRLWQVINKIVGRSRNKLELPDKIKDANNIIINGTEAIANAFCKFFANVGPNLANKIPQSSKNFDAFMHQIRCNDSLFLAPTDELEIAKFISNLPNKSSSSHDELSNVLIKQLSPVICRPLCITFNKSINEGVFPQEMKLADVVPIYKSKERLSCTNYRPVSLVWLSNSASSIVNMGP